MLTWGTKGFIDVLFQDIPKCQSYKNDSTVICNQSAAFCNDIHKWLDFLVFLHKDSKLYALSHNPSMCSMYTVECKKKKTHTIRKV